MNLKAYEYTRPKIEKSVRNDLKETYESFKLFESTFSIINCYDVLFHLCMKNHQPLLTIFKNAIIVVDEFNRIKKQKKHLQQKLKIL